MSGRLGGLRERGLAQGSMAQTPLEQGRGLQVPSNSPQGLRKGASPSVTTAHNGDKHRGLGKTGPSHPLPER